MRHPTPRSGHRRPPLIAAALAGLCTATLGLGAAQAAPVEDGDRTITYRGYQVDVPADWRIVDFTETPHACLRFDEPAVYLGTTGEQEDCPARLVGRTAGLVIEPLVDAAAGQLTEATEIAEPGTARAPGVESRDDALHIAVEDAGVLVTALHTPSTEESVRAILDQARLTGAAEYAAVPEPVGVRADTHLAGPQPGDFLGLGFDACTAPSQAAMDAWEASSPYQAVGVYISGATRGCAQPNLTADWVENQTGNGWHLIPIDVGRQAPCSTYANRISADPATARAQGGTAANGSVAAARALGIPEGSVLYSDIEAYTPGGTCTAGVLSYLSGWTEALHDDGYLAGVYSSAASGIADVAAAYHDSAYIRVDHIWFAWWNGQADTDTGQYVPSEYWSDHQRIHQYVGEVTETHGGVSINIDRNYLDVGQ